MGCEVIEAPDGWVDTPKTLPWVGHGDQREFAIGGHESAGHGFRNPLVVLQESELDDAGRR
jgi:hypothetical protein